MGFVSGFTGGVTLTLGLAYLTVYSHDRNRQAQALHLRSQHQLLNSLVEPIPQPPSHAELARQSRSTFTETAKDRWNYEVENAVRWVQTTDWNAMRGGMEGSIARLLGSGLQISREGIEEAQKQVEPKVQQAVKGSRAAVTRGTEQAAVGVDPAAAETIILADRINEAAKSGFGKAATIVREGLEDAGAKTRDVAFATKATAKEAIAETRTGMDNAVTSTRDAVDRGFAKAHEVADKARVEGQSTRTSAIVKTQDVLRNVVSKGGEEGKEVIGKVQEAAGLTTGKVRPTTQVKSSALQESDVEKALRERYETPKGFDRSADEVLEERYCPVAQ